MLSRTLRGVAAIVLVGSVSAASLPSGFGSLPCRLRGGGPDEDSSVATSMLRRSSSQEAINQFQRELRGGEPAVEKPTVQQPEPTVVSSFFSVFESKQKAAAPSAAPGETKKDPPASEPVAAIPTAKAAAPVATSAPTLQSVAPVVEAKPVPVAAPETQVPRAPSQPTPAPQDAQATAAPTGVQATAAPTGVQGVQATAAQTGVQATVAPTGVQATAAPTGVQGASAPTESDKQPVGAPPASTPPAATPQTNAEKIASARPAVVATAMGLGQASPRAQLDMEEARLLVEADKFLDEVRTEPIDTADTARVQSVVKKNRLFVLRCKSVLEKTVDSFTRKQVETRIASLEAAYEQSSTVSHKTTREKLTLVRSPSMECLLGDSEEEDYDTANPARMVSVTFEVMCDMTAPEEKVLIIGDRKELGAWNSLAAVEMTTDETQWPKWSQTVFLPAGRVVEYKYAVGVKGMWLDQYNVKEWEGHMGNRSFKVGRRKHKVTDEFMTPFRNADPRPPSFVHMARSASSECFLDPEYSGLPAMD